MPCIYNSTRFLVSPSVSAFTPRTLRFRFTYGDPRDRFIDEPVMRAGVGDLRYYHRTQQYSVIALTDSSGNVTERYAYTAYGTPTITDGAGIVLTASADNNRYTYTGREWDETLGLYHFRARMYDSRSGRFFGRDPAWYSDGMNVYRTYVSLNNLDPSGMCACSTKSRCTSIAHNCNVKPKCTVKGTPSLTIHVWPDGNKWQMAGDGKSQYYQIFLKASFVNNPANGDFCACCSVRYMIKWNQKYHQLNGGKPHEGFPQNASADTWYEDVLPNDPVTKKGGGRYGYRCPPNQLPRENKYFGYFDSEILPVGDPGQQSPGRPEYGDPSTANELRGCEYRNADRPQTKFPGRKGGAFTFALMVVDTCKKGAPKALGNADSNQVTVDWR